MNDKIQEGMWKCYTLEEICDYLTPIKTVMGTRKIFSGKEVARIIRKNLEFGDSRSILWYNVTRSHGIRERCRGIIEGTIKREIVYQDCYIAQVGEIITFAGYSKQEIIDWYKKEYDEELLEKDLTKENGATYWHTIENEAELIEMIRKYKRLTIREDIINCGLCAFLKPAIDEIKENNYQEPYIIASTAY